jgi:hypothetical protein
LPRRLAARATGGTFYFTKAPSANTGGLLTDIIGTSSPGDAAITFITNGTLYGLPIMDDNAFQNENWAYVGAETSTITSIGGTQQFSGPYVLINDINTDALTGDLTLNWSFAKGVGPTSIALNGQTITLTSFSINPTASQSQDRRALSVASARALTASHGLALLKALF